MLRTIFILLVCCTKFQLDGGFSQPTSAVSYVYHFRLLTKVRVREFEKVVGRKRTDLLDPDTLD